MCNSFCFFFLRQASRRERETFIRVFSLSEAAADKRETLTFDSPNFFLLQATQVFHHVVSAFWSQLVVKFLPLRSNDTDTEQVENVIDVCQVIIVSNQSV